MTSVLPARDADPGEEALVRAFIHDRFVDMFVGQNRRAQAGLLLASVIVGAVWWARTGSVLAPAWLALVALICGARFAYTERFVRAAVKGRETGRIALVLLVNGVMMAVPLLAFGQFSPVERAAVSIVLLASATASAATTTGYRTVFLIFAVPMLVPLAGAWVWAGLGTAEPAGAFGLAVLVLAFLAFLASVGRQVSQTFEDSSRYRYGEQQLTRRLTRALERADELNRAKTQFLAAASHDLRQPIHGITTLIGALSLKRLDPGTREIVDLLDNVNQVLSRQLDSLLDVSKLDAGVVRPNLSVQWLDGLVAGHVDAVRPVAAAAGVEVLAGRIDRCAARTDPSLLQRVLGNLTDNAIKFTPAGGRITVSLEQRGDRLRLSVADTGIGIAPEDHERVFREFYQVGNDSRDRSRGLGLGLAIVRRLAELLGAEIDLASVPGEGTTITLVLPATEGPAPVAPPVPRPGLTEHLRVLVADDEALVRDSMRMLLSELGCEVRVAATHEDAVREASAWTPDVFLSDLRLGAPGRGFETIRAVRERHPDCVVALITGDTGPQAMRDAKASGIPLLYKPVSASAVFDLIMGPGVAGTPWDLRR